MKTRPLYRPILLFLFLLPYSFHSKAQDCKCDESKPIQEKYTRLLQQAKMDSAKIVLEDFKKLKSPVCLSIYHSNLAFIHFRLRKYEQALKSLAREYKILNSESCNRKAYLNYYLTKGLIYSDTDVLDSAASNILKAIEIGEEFQMKTGLAGCYSSMCMVFGKMNRMDKVIYYTKKSIKLNRELNDYFYLSRNFYLLSNAYSVLAGQKNNEKYYDTLNIVLDSALANTRKSGNPSGMPGIYYNKAEFFIHLKDYTKAQTYIDSSIQYAIKDMHEANLPWWYLRKAEISLLQNKPDQGLPYTDSAYYYARIVKSVSTIQSVYDTKYRLYKAKNDFKNALFYSEKMVALKDSLNLQESTQNITELEKKYNQIKNEKKISELTQQKQIDRIRTWVIVGIAVFILILIIFLYRQSIAKSKLRQIQTEQRLNRARMNPHFIFNVLSALQTLNMDEKRQKEVGNYVNRFSKIMRQSLESTFTELNSLEDELEFLKSYLELQKMLSGNKFDYAIELDHTIDAFETVLPGMIIQPFLENAIEHGFAGMTTGGFIQMNIQARGEQLVVVITDNGSGVSLNPAQKQYPSRATQIVHDRLYLLRKTYKKEATFDLSKNENGGMKVTLTLPLLFEK